MAQKSASKVIWDGKDTPTNSCFSFLVLTTARNVMAATPPSARPNRNKNNPVNKFLSVDFTKFQKFTVFLHNAVKQFYKSRSDQIPLTIAHRLRARINPNGMAIASNQARG